MATTYLSHHLPSSTLNYGIPHIQVGSFPILLQTLVGSIPIFPPSLHLKVLPFFSTQNITSNFTHGARQTILSPCLNPSVSILNCQTKLRNAQAKPEFWSTSLLDEPSSANPFCCSEKNINKPFCIPENDNFPIIRESLLVSSSVSGKAEETLPHTCSKSYASNKVCYNSEEENEEQFPIQRPFHLLDQHRDFSIMPKNNLTSILGPHPSSIPKQRTIPSKKVSNSHKIKNSISKNSSSPKKPINMSLLSEEDEMFIQKFVGLSTADQNSEEVVVPFNATTSTNWDLCLLARVVTDRVVLDGPFSKAMLQAWGADPTTTMKQVTKNHYLFEFTRVEDLNSAKLGGVWTYRGDLVALKQVNSDQDLNLVQVDHAVVWVLFLNLPVNAFKDEGLLIIAKKVGEPVSVLVKGFVHGRRFVKVKVLIPVGEPVKDYINVNHPSLGQITVYCAYEKISRICLFCGTLGHEMAGCQDHPWLALLTKKPGQEERFKDVDILSPWKGAWLTNPALAPGLVVRRNETNSQSDPRQTAAQAGDKRNFENSVHEVSSNNQFLGENVMGQQVEVAEGNLMVCLDLENSTRGSNSKYRTKRPRPAGPNTSAMDI